MSNVNEADIAQEIYDHTEGIDNWCKEIIRLTRLRAIPNLISDYEKAMGNAIERLEKAKCPVGTQKIKAKAMCADVGKKLNEAEADMKAAQVLGKLTTESLSGLQTLYKGRV